VVYEHLPLRGVLRLGQALPIPPEGPPVVRDS
jgi:hypothetical protein